MKMFKSLGKGVGTVGGLIIGGSVKVTGKIVGTKYKAVGEYIEEIGDATQSASKAALENVGQLIDGTVQGGYGLIKNDNYYKSVGMDDIKESAGKTLKGIGSTLKYTASNVGSTYKGFRGGNTAEAIQGLKNIGKVVAVSSLAIGVLDVIDGADMAQAEDMDTINDNLSSHEHPETGVPFVEKTVELPYGQVIEGTFPVFQSEFRVELAEEVYLESDSVQFGIANDTLYLAIQEEPSLASQLGLSQTDVQGLLSGQTPDGYTWHHYEDMGVLQLVDEDVHAQTAHTGGRAIWGGGREFR